MRDEPLDRCRLRQRILAIQDDHPRMPHPHAGTPGNREGRTLWVPTGPQSHWGGEVSRGFSVPHRARCEALSPQRARNLLLATSREADQPGLGDPSGDCISWTATAKQALARGKGKAARRSPAFPNDRGAAAVRRRGASGGFGGVSGAVRGRRAQSRDGQAGSIHPQARRRAPVSPPVEMTSLMDNPANCSEDTSCPAGLPTRTWTTRTPIDTPTAPRVAHIPTGATTDQSI